MPPTSGERRALFVRDGRGSVLTGRDIAELGVSLPETADQLEAVDDNNVWEVLSGRKAGEGRTFNTVDWSGAPAEGDWLIFECAPCGHIVRMSV